MPTYTSHPALRENGCRGGFGVLSLRSKRRDLRTGRLGEEVSNASLLGVLRKKLGYGRKLAALSARFFELGLEGNTSRPVSLVTTPADPHVPQVIHVMTRVLGQEWVPLRFRVPTRMFFQQPELFQATDLLDVQVAVSARTGILKASCPIEQKRIEAVGGSVTGLGWAELGVHQASKYMQPIYLSDRQNAAPQP